MHTHAHVSNATSRLISWGLISVEARTAVGSIGGSSKCSAPATAAPLPRPRPKRCPCQHPGPLAHRNSIVIDSQSRPKTPPVAPDHAPLKSHQPAAPRSPNSSWGCRGLPSGTAAADQRQRGAPGPAAAAMGAAGTVAALGALLLLHCIYAVAQCEWVQAAAAAGACCSDLLAPATAAAVRSSRCAHRAARRLSSAHRAASTCAAPATPSFITPPHLYPPPQTATC